MIEILTRWFWMDYFLSFGFKKSSFLCKLSFNII